jgi:hypothetical protein
VQAGGVRRVGKNEITGEGILPFPAGQQVACLQLAPVPDPEPPREAALELFLCEAQVVFELDVGSVAVGAVDPHLGSEEHHGSRRSELPFVVEVIANLLGEQSTRGRHAREDGEGSENTVKQGHGGPGAEARESDGTPLSWGPTSRPASAECR